VLGAVAFRALTQSATDWPDTEERSVKNRRCGSAAAIRAVIVFAAALALLAPPIAAYSQDSKTYVMKLSTATINDVQHEWMKRFVAAVEKDSGGRIKGEIYPASQLGPIPRQIEGTQFGSIQGWVGPPEFLVGVDERYEAMTAPALFTSLAQHVRVINDPPVNDMMLRLGADKGLVGLGIFPGGVNSVVTRKPVRHVAEFKGMKIRVLASPFQLEMVKRMDASPVAMSLGDVLMGLQQGAIDGSLGNITVFTPLHYQDAAKYVTEIDQPYVSPIAVMNKKWLEALPADLQAIVRGDAATASKEIVPFLYEFIAAQHKEWTDKGGELINLPADEQAALNARISSIGDDLSKDRPELNKAVNVIVESAARNR
jgi:TRAP-type C4-dicarboxylate transport system substrate-binding protein